MDISIIGVREIVNQEERNNSSINDGYNIGDEANQSIRTSPPSVLPIDTLQVRFQSKKIDSKLFYLKHIV